MIRFSFADIPSRIVIGVETPGTVLHRPFFPRRAAAPFLFLLLLLDLKVDGSINEGPFPKGKGHQRAREDFQPVKGVVCIDGFAVRVLLTLSIGD